MADIDEYTETALVANLEYLNEKIDKILQDYLQLVTDRLDITSKLLKLKENNGS